MRKYIKPIPFILSAVMLLSAINAHAYDFYTVFDGDTIYYNITNNTDMPYTVEVTHDGNHNTTSYQGGIVIPSTVTYNGVSYIVTRIGDNALNNCRNMTSISIPNTVTSFGNGAFAGCISLTHITIPNTVTSIDIAAFSSCISLTSLEIPSSVINLHEFAIDGCSNMTMIVVDTNNTVYADINGVLFNKALTTLLRCPEGKSGTYTIPSSTAIIKRYAFDGCSRLTSIVFPDTPITIHDGAFRNCTGLTLFTLPNTVQLLGNPFHGCTGLTGINLENGNTNYRVNNGVLFNITGTTLICYPAGRQGSYTIPNTVTTIGTSAFSGCTGLTSVSIPNSVTIVGAGAFFNCFNLVSAVLPNSLTGIGNSAFANCYSILSINIPNGIRRLEYGTINNCNSLTSVTLSNTLTTLEGRNIYACQSLQKITIPASVTSIGYSCISWCQSLDTIVFESTTPPPFDSECFFNVPRSTVVVVPCGCGPAYRNALSQWFYNFVEDCSPVSIAETESHNPVLLYPNPASSTVTIEGLEENSSIQIVNTLGGVVKRIENIGQKTTISVGDLPKGLYFVRTNGTMRKLVVE